jgi:hypothetical protein
MGKKAHARSQKFGCGSAALGGSVANIFFNLIFAIFASAGN